MCTKSLLTFFLDPFDDGDEFCPAWVSLAVSTEREGEFTATSDEKNRVIQFFWRDNVHQRNAKVGGYFWISCVSDEVGVPH